MDVAWPVIVLVATLATVSVVLYGALWWHLPPPTPGRWAAEAIILRVERENRFSTSGFDPALWVSGWPHEGPERGFTVGEAHEVMRRHRGCVRAECPRKRAAWEVLVAAGRIRPDVREDRRREGDRASRPVRGGRLG